MSELFYPQAPNRTMTTVTRKKVHFCIPCDCGHFLDLQRPPNDFRTTSVNLSDFPPNPKAE